jgi:hypothetical protein
VSHRKMNGNPWKKYCVMLGKVSNLPNLYMCKELSLAQPKSTILGTQRTFNTFKFPLHALDN